LLLLLGGLPPRITGVVQLLRPVVMFVLCRSEGLLAN